VYRYVVAPALLVGALTFPLAAWAASDAELAEIREQIKQLKENYEASSG